MKFELNLQIQTIQIQFKCSNAHFGSFLFYYYCKNELSARLCNFLEKDWLYCMNDAKNTKGTLQFVTPTSQKIFCKIPRSYSPFYFCADVVKIMICHFYLVMIFLPL